jgi:hypothetical protein
MSYKLMQSEFRLVTSYNGAYCCGLKYITCWWQLTHMIISSLYIYVPYGLQVIDSRWNRGRELHWGIMSVPAFVIKLHTDEWNRCLLYTECPNTEINGYLKFYNKWSIAWHLRRYNEQWKMWNDQFSYSLHSFTV